MTGASESAPPARPAPPRLALALALLGVDLGLRLLGLGRMRSLLRSRDRARPRPPDAERLEGARELARRVERAAGFRVYRVPCLARALLLERLLARRGLPATLRIGVRRPGRPGAARLDAHAWVECGDLCLDPDPRVAERFAPLS